jgi:imidazolonepropionase-like amidohydrolase
VAALDAACWGARAWLGADGLSEGASADVVVCREDPRKAPSAVAALQNIVLRGEVVR